jgi:hypothetical protein
MDLEAKRAMVRRIRAGLSVTEIFCTRILKTKDGSVLVGLTASLDDPSAMEEGEIATLILGERVDQLALERAMAAGLISDKQRAWGSDLTKNNYHLLLDEHMQKVSGTVTAPLVLTGTEDDSNVADGPEETPDDPKWMEGLSE